MTQINNHWAIFVSNTTNHQSFIQQLLQGHAAEPFIAFNTQKGLLFSTITLKAFIEEEDRHEHTDVLKNTTRTLKSMSSGERKKALLAYLLSQQPDFIILDNPFDNLDVTSQQMLRNELTNIAHQTAIIQVASRKLDKLEFISNTYTLNDAATKPNIHFTGSIPPPLKHYEIATGTLVEFKNVTVK